MSAARPEVPVYERVSHLPVSPRSWLLDVWGVLIDGERPYPGALACLVEIRARGGRVILISNVTDTSAGLGARLTALGVQPSLYDHCVTAGDHTRAGLGTTRWHGALGGRYLHVGERAGAALLDGLPYAPVRDVGAADFLFVTHDAGAGAREEVYGSVLPRALDAGLPMVCANPDVMVTRLDGRRITRAGALAREYASRGGAVHYFGKPEPSFYDALPGLAGVPRRDVIAIGDGLDTDVAGALGAGIAAYLVDRRPRAARGELHPRPTGVLCDFVW
jgi:HAD superfamily hydrolase (TIGR01459 family)